MKLHLIIQLDERPSVVYGPEGFYLGGIIMLDVNVLAGSFWPNTLEGWVSLISFIIGFVGAIVALIPMTINLVKKGKELIKNKDWDKIKEIADVAMKKAEETGKTGAEKKEIVIAAVKAGCEEAGIIINEQLLKNLADYIDATIEWVNSMIKAKNKKK